MTIKPHELGSLGSGGAMSEQVEHFLQDVEPRLVAPVDEVSLDLNQRARTDQAHFAAQDVYQLWKLVE